MEFGNRCDGKSNATLVSLPLTIVYLGAVDDASMDELTM
jgi:hypothetical protein